MAGPTPYPSTPFALPTDGAWRQTPFVGSPIFSDLDGNGTDELITPAAGGRLLAFTADPTTGAIRLFQSYNTGAEANFKSTPAVIDTPNGKVIVAALGRDESQPFSLEDGRVFAFDAKTGAILPGWPQNTDRPPPDARRSAGVTGPIATGDLDGDGVPEIVVTSFSTMVTAFKLDGTKIWQFENDETVEPGAVIADLDRDGKNEVIYTSGISSSQYYPAGGMITILNGNGSLQRRLFTGESFFGSPIVADLNGDGKLEIIAATGPYFNTAAPDEASRAAARAAGNRVYAFDYLGRTVPGWPYHTTTNDALDRQTWKEPAAADLNGDGRPEIVVIDRSGRLHVIGPNGQALPGFEGGKVINPQAQGLANNDAFSSPIIADVNGDGQQDIIAAHAFLIKAFDATGQEIFSSYTPVPPGTGIPEGIGNAGAVGQFDGKPGLELAFVSNSSIPPGPPRGVSIFNLPVSSVAPAWPMLRKDAGNHAVAYNKNFLLGYINNAYRALIGRAPTFQESVGGYELLNTGRTDLLNFAVALTTGPEGKARWDGVFQGSEADIAKRLAPIYQTITGSNQIPADALAAIAFDSHRNRPASLIAAQVVSTGGNYASTQLLAGWIRSLYRDIFGRQASPDEVAAWFRVFDNNSVTPEQMVRYLLNSPEGRIQYIRGQVRELLGRDLTNDDVNRYLFYQRREDVVVAIVLGDEYLRRNGGTVEGLVRGFYRDIAKLDPAPASDVAFWVNQIQRGRSSPADLATALVNGPTYRDALVVDDLFRYVPDESRGVLRLPLGLTGPPINPDPALVNFYVYALNVGYSQDDVLVSLLMSYKYILNSSYDQGFFIGRGIRR